MSRVAVLLVSVVAGVALVYAVATGIDQRAGPPIVFEDPLVDAVIVVALEGAVATPGAYELPADARLADAVAAAGGFAAGADLAAVNPARRLRDEERVAVPRIAPTIDPSAAAAADGAATSPDAADADTNRDVAPPPPVADTPIDLNAASAEELDALPGIGPVIAQRIVERRTTEGPFESADDLVEVQGISGRMVDELRDLVVAGAGAP